MTVHDRPDLRLRVLGVDDEAEATAAHQTMAGEFTFLLAYEPGEPWPDYVAHLEAYRAGVDLPERWVSSTFLVAEVDGAIVGRASIRHELSNDFLAAEGGHIGYAVLPEHRRRGFASEILRQALEVVHGLGVDRALVCCDEDNVASVAVIQRVGGTFESVTTGEEGQVVRRHWFDLA